MVGYKKPSEDGDYDDFFDRFFMTDSTDIMANFLEK